MAGLGVSFQSRSFSLRELTDYAVLAENSGCDSFWLTESWGHDALVALTRAACHTSRIKLATGIINVFSRTPAQVAMAAATLSRASGGRFVLGLGVSGRGVVEGWHGMRFHKPLRRMREFVEILRLIFEGGKVDYVGEIFRLKGFSAAALKVDPPPPIYVACLHPGMARLAARVADGVLLYLQPRSRIGLVAKTLVEEARAAGRSPDAVDIAAYLPTCVHDDAAKAAAHVKKTVAFYIGSMGEYYYKLLAGTRFAEEAPRVRELWRGGERAKALEAVGPEMLDELALTGSPSEVRDKLSRFLAAGVRSPILHFSQPDPEGRAGVERAIQHLL